MQAHDFPRPVYTREYSKDVPQRLLVHKWQRTVDVNKLPKIQLRVRMCCAKCEEKVKEEIWEVPGVFDVRAHWMEDKVVVTAAVGVDEYPAVDQCAVLRKARKIDCRARFVQLDPTERPPVTLPKVTTVTPNPGKTVTNPPPPPPKDPLLPPIMYHNVVYEPYSTPPPPQDTTPAFYFLFLVLLLVSMYVFRR